MKRIKLLSIVLCTFMSFNAFAQEKKADHHTADHPATPVVPATTKQAPKPYKEVITAQAKTQKGAFVVHQVDDKIYFEIPDSILNRDILLVSRIAKAGADWRNTTTMTGYAGDMINQSVIRFEIAPKNRVFVRELSFSERSRDSTREMYRSVNNSNVQPVVLSFDIKAWHTDTLSKHKNAVIDMTDIINGDNDLFFFGANRSKFNIGSFQQDKSYFIDVKTFPINTEIRTFKTFSRVPQISMQSSNGQLSQSTINNPHPVSIELNTSMVLLPLIPMKARYADDRVGYFTTSYTDFDASSQGVKRRNIIERWRLEPRDEDMAKYKRGELVEPKNPIVIYIDPETPEKWVPYLIKGVNDWQVAFEKAGFKNAIVAKRAPTPSEDPSWNIDDARHSAIVYKPSSIPNASGPHVVDPRSGEVIETHVNWYHNVMQLVHDWYMIQAGPIDPRARKMQFDDELMGELIRFVSSHEVGHTLGLLHNFGASWATPVEKLRDKAWVEANGHTVSIMDYARFNYVAQPEDHISEKGIFPRIGVYDKWAIEWGYKLMPSATTPEAEEDTLNKWVIAKSRDQRYWFGGEMGDNDPRVQSEDLGNDAVKASRYGIKNLKRVVANLPEWTKVPNEGYSDLAMMHKEVYRQLMRYMGHVIKSVGGRYENDKTVEQPGAVYKLVPAQIQHQSMMFINEQLLNTPTWLIDKRILSLTGSTPTEIINALQTETLAKLISKERVGLILAGQSFDDKAYKITDYFHDLEAGVWGELDTKRPITIFRRNLQKAFIDRLALVVKPLTYLPGTNLDDYPSVARASVIHIKSKIIAAKSFYKDPLTRAHLDDLLSRINNALTSK